MTVAGIVNSNRISLPTAGSSSAANSSPFADTSSVTPGYSRSAVWSTISKRSGKRTAARTGMLSYDRYRVAKRPSFRELLPIRSSRLMTTYLFSQQNSSAERVTKEFYCTSAHLHDHFHNISSNLSAGNLPVQHPPQHPAPLPHPSRLWRFGTGFLPQFPF